jgi:hypothetical protein
LGNLLASVRHADGNSDFGVSSSGMVRRPGEIAYRVAGSGWAGAGFAMRGWMMRSAW